MKARPGGFEPPTYGLEVRCSIRLSYGRITLFYRLFLVFPGVVTPVRLTTTVATAQPADVGLTTLAIGTGTSCRQKHRWLRPGGQHWYFEYPQDGSFHEVRTFHGTLNHPGWSNWNRDQRRLSIARRISCLSDCFLIFSRLSCSFRPRATASFTFTIPREK